jgi:hypothetical protein
VADNSYHTQRLFQHLEESQSALEAQIEDSKQALARSDRLLSKLQDTMRQVSAQFGPRTTEPDDKT